MKRISLTQYLVEQQPEHGHIPAQLRPMYEANPMAFLVEQAGGLSTNRSQRILDIAPARRHERVSVLLGSKNEVQRITDFHADQPAAAHLA